MSNLAHQIPVVYDLGIRNVLTVVAYRTLLRTGTVKMCMPPGIGYTCQMFENTSQITMPSFVYDKKFILKRADTLLQGRYKYFFYHDQKVGSPPDWFNNPFNNIRMTFVDKHWSEIDDFSSGIGDIKIIWDLSRFQWVVHLALAFRVSNNQKYLELLNEWISSWTLQNPLNVGPNWKCGQEAGLRTIQVLLAAYLLDQHRSPTNELLRFVQDHCHRIEPTIYYALALNNNHGTSEAAALFIGGTWLMTVSNDKNVKVHAARWQRKGRKWLEKLTRNLIKDDGTFSQYSVVYHRLLVETLSVVELWRREFGNSQFTGHFYKKAGSAVSWIISLTDPISGDAPNIGSNDGTQLLSLSPCSYRDFRPCAQLGASLFLGSKPYPVGPWDEVLNWLGICPNNNTNSSPEVVTRQFRDGGYVVLIPKSRLEGHSWAVLRYPNFHFRPGHADGMHLDLWSGGVNLIRGSGSYSYNTVDPCQSYFGATRSHNTIEFDDRDQMPKLSRFLHGSWLKMLSVEDCCERRGALSWSGTYIDYLGSRHMRRVEYVDGTWKITDQVVGMTNKAVLRWRLAPSKWFVEKHRCFGDMAELTVESSVPIRRSEIVNGWESRYYLHKEVLPVWEVAVDRGPATLTTVIRVKQETLS